MRGQGEKDSGRQGLVSYCTGDEGDPAPWCSAGEGLRKRGGRGKTSRGSHQLAGAEFPRSRAYEGAG